MGNKSKVENTINTFEMLMDPKKREREAKEIKEREMKRTEKIKKREQKSNREVAESKLRIIKEKMKVRSEKYKLETGGGAKSPQKQSQVKQAKEKEKTVR